MVKKVFLTMAVFGLLFAGSGYAKPLVNGLGGGSDFGESFLARNDDGSTAWLDLSGVFPNGLNFFGTSYTGLYLNNNGNVTFSASQWTYTPYALTGATGNPLIAPFFADVDTRSTTSTVSPGGTSTGSNLLHYDFDTTNGIFTATWDDVGYYWQSADSIPAQVNAFQLALIDQSDGNSAGDFDIEFLYEYLTWTTGDASGGSGGLGGTVARAGWNSGNGTDYYELSQSGNQSAMLALTSASNVNDAGRFLFQVRNGQVIDNDDNDGTVPEPTTLFLLGSGLLGLAGLKRKRKS